MECAKAKLRLKRMKKQKKPRREKNDRQRRAAASNIFCAR